MIAFIGIAFVFAAVGWLVSVLLKYWPLLGEEERPRVRLGIWLLVAVFVLGGVFVASLHQLTVPR